VNEFDQQMVHALAHPLRVEILRYLEAGPSSPKRISDRIGEQLSNVSYHIRVLLQCDCLELLETIPQRGTVEHIYKLKGKGALGARTWKAVPSCLRTHYAGTALADFTNRAVEALDAGTAESREGSGVTWLPLLVDEQGWNELRRGLSKCEERFQAVAEKSAARMENPRDVIPVIVAVAAFEVASGEDGNSA
jgi:DNA-binding transcriptional ArsR family regulator